MMKLTTVGLLLLLTLTPAFAGELQMEASVTADPWPICGMDVGASVSVRLGTAPDATPLFGNSFVFGDLSLIDGQAAVGISAGILPAARDNGWRLGVTLWQEEARAKKLYVRYAWPFTLNW